MEKLYRVKVNVFDVRKHCALPPNFWFYRERNVKAVERKLAEDIKNKEDIGIKITILGIRELS